MNLQSGNNTSGVLYPAGRTVVSFGSSLRPSSGPGSHRLEKKKVQTPPHKQNKKNKKPERRWEASSSGDVSDNSKHV